MPIFQVTKHINTTHEPWASNLGENDNTPSTAVKWKRSARAHHWSNNPQAAGTTPRSLEIETRTAPPPPRGATQKIVNCHSLPRARLQNLRAYSLIGFNRVELHPTASRCLSKPKYYGMLPSVPSSKQKTNNLKYNFRLGSHNAGTWEAVLSMKCYAMVGVTTRQIQKSHTLPINWKAF